MLDMLDAARGKEGEKRCPCYELDRLTTLQQLFKTMLGVSSLCIHLAARHSSTFTTAWMGWSLPSLNGFKIAFLAPRN